MDEMKCGSTLGGGFMELLGFHQHFIPPPPPIFSSSISTTANSASISISDHHQHHDQYIFKDHDQHIFKDRELLLNYNVMYHRQQQPATPTSSTISSESSAGGAALTNDAACHPDQQTSPLDDTREEHQPRLHPSKPLQKLKIKKSNEMKNNKEVQRRQKQQQQRNKEARVAFMTRSDVDHLEDGFRWRKYGQKAVKNSPFPRSYYRCTNAACNVKKRVERSLNDPTVVVTTYEGKHTHPSPIVMHRHYPPQPPPFTAANFASPPQIMIPQSHLQVIPHFGNLHPLRNDVGKDNNMLISTSTHDRGLLQDIVPSLGKEE